MNKFSINLDYTTVKGVTNKTCIKYFLMLIINSDIWI
uniref:Uncharacterized protein n=1 Tax=Lepeophtheirus salmonis TaxID=72036 RepID=A0A0K2TH72_LEPSM